MSHKRAEGQESISYQALLDENQAQLNEIKAQSDEIQALKSEIESLKERQSECEEFKQSEYRLRDNEKRYRMLFTNMTEGFGLVEVIYSSEGKLIDYRYLEINPFFELCLGVKKEQLLGKTISETFPHLSPIATEKYDEVALSGQPINFEIFSQVANKYLDIHAFIPEKGKIALILRDITERKKTEDALQQAYEELQTKSKELEVSYEELQVQNEELQVQHEELQAQTKELEEAYQALGESEKHYRMLFTNMTEGFLLAEIICDKAGKPYDYRYLEMNPAFELHTSIKREQVFGKTALEVFHSVPPIEVKEFGKVALSGGSTHFEVFAPPVEKYFEVYAFSPEYGKFAVIFTDITKHKQAEDKLRYHANLVDNISDAIISTDKELNIKSWNKAAEQIYGWQADEVIGLNGSEILQTTFPEKLNREVIAKDIFEKGYWEGELVQRTKDGRDIIVFGKSMVLKDEAGAAVGGVSISSDITERKKAEAKIQKLMASVIQEKETLSALVESIPDEVWFTDNQKKVTLVNPAVLKDFGNITFENPDVEAIAGSSEVYRPDGTLRPIEEAPPLRTLKGEIIKNQEEIVRTPASGELRFRQVNASPVKDASGNVIGSVAVVRDITELKQAEEALKKAYDTLEEKVKERTAELQKAYESLKESEKDLAEAQKMSHLGNWKWDILTNELHWSDEVYRIFGLKPQEFKATFDAYFKYVHPDDRAYLNDAIKKAFEGEPYSVDNRIITANGEERVVHTEAEITFNENNIPVYARGSVQDITERMQAEKALCESEKRYRLLHDSLRDAFAEVSMAGQVIDFNNQFCEMLGYSPEELRTLTYKDLTPERWHAFEDKIVREQVIPNGYSEIYEKEYQRKDGTIFPVELRTTLLRDDAGQPISMWAIVRNITERKRAEEELRESEARYRSLYENSFDGIALTNANGTVFAANPQACRLFGMTEDEIIKAGRDLVVEDENFMAALEKRELTGNAVAEITFRRKDGSTFIGETSSSIFIDADGSKKASMIIRDVTERKKAEEALRESEERFNKFMNNSPTIAWMKDDQGRRVYLSKTYENRFGVKLVDWFGKTDFEIWPLEIAEEFWKNDREVLDTNKTIEVIEKTQNSDGSYTYWLSYKFPFRDASGKRYIGGIGIDITKRKQAEEEIQNLANIVESSNDAIVTKSLDGIITSWNKGAEQLYGYSAEEVLGKPVSILEPPMLPEETRKLTKMVKQGEKNKQYETLRIRKDGKIIHVSINLSPVFDINGKLSAISVIARDITKRKEAEEALAKIEIARKKEIHHRIKNNLQVISSLLDLQAEQFRDKRSIKDYEVLDAFRESQDRVISMALIHEELYKGGGFETLNFAPYIEELAENLLRTYKLGNTDISLKLNLAEDASFDMDIAVPLGMIVNELVSNSLKHAFIGRDEGEIQITLHREESTELACEDCESTTFTLTISDNGVGIPESLDIEDFDSLGMQLVTSLVDQLDGEFELKRNNGTEFTMRFSVKENSSSVSVAVPELIE